jgi:Chaperone of endosialidase
MNAEPKENLMLPYPFVQGIRLPTGTSNVPSLSFTEDSRTGCYLPAPNTLGIVTDLTNRLTVTNQAVTIGEMDNACALEVYGRSTVNGNLEVKGTFNPQYCKVSEKISVGMGEEADYPIHVHTNVDGISIFCESDMVVFSDSRIKEQVKPIEDALSKLEKIKGYTFLKNGSTKKTCGLIAQELIQVLPEAVHTHEPTGLLTIAYDNVIALLVNAINELRKEVESIKCK